MLEDNLKRYLRQLSKEAIIELYLQMRFERDLYEHMLTETKRNCELIEKLP